MKKLSVAYNVSQFSRTWLGVGALALSLCCAPAMALDKQPRIVGGTDADIADFPWQVALVDSIAPPYNSICGGSIINERWILTAAHCKFDDNGNVPVKAVLIGTADLTDTAAAQVIPVSRFIIHEDFVDLNAAQEGEFALDNDIAVIELSEAIDFTECGSRCAKIEPLTSSDEGTLAPVSAAALVSGWGNLSGDPDANDFPDLLQQADVNILDCTSSPVLYTSDMISPNMMCASANDFSRDGCTGDSGGPLVVPNGEGTGYVQAGIVSWGSSLGCAITGYPGVYTRVANFSRWIWDATDGACCNEPVVVSPIDELVDRDGGGGNGGALPLTLLFGLPLVSMLIRNRRKARA